MARSSGFGSVNNDKRPVQTRFRYGFSFITLTCHYLQVAGSFFNRHEVKRLVVLPLLVGLRFHVLFHSPPGVLFTFPSRYWFTIGCLGIFSLTRWSSQIHTVFHVHHTTRDTTCEIMLSITGLSPSMAKYSKVFT